MFYAFFVTQDNIQSRPEWFEGEDATVITNERYSIVSSLNSMLYNILCLAWSNLPTYMVICY